jgi:hypothetical protein
MALARFTVRRWGLCFVEEAVPGHGLQSSWQLGDGGRGHTLDTVEIARPGDAWFAVGARFALIGDKHNRNARCLDKLS